MIYAPRVPVFRGDDDQLLDAPYPVSFLTAPAVNAGAIRRNEPGNAALIESTMLSRIEKVLTVALLHGHFTLVLGAWGCGVFQNDPERVADWFGRYLLGEGPFSRAFQRVAFAVLDRTADSSVIGPFARRFAP